MSLTALGATVAMAIGAVPVTANPNQPLGRYSGLITAGVTVMSLAFAFLTHVGAFGWMPDPFIDLVASIAVGVVFGRGVGISEGATQVSAQLADRGNLNTRLALAAHERLDSVGAPPAYLEDAQTVVGSSRPPEGR